MTDEQRDRSRSKALMQLEDATTEALETDTKHITLPTGATIPITALIPDRQGNDHGWYDTFGDTRCGYCDVLVWDDAAKEPCPGPRP
jgi:hypothetical protein